MKITPIEIRKKSFEKAFRGYEKEEVDTFLKSLSQEWEKLNEHAKDLKRNLEVSEKELKRLRDVEVSLINALKSSESAGVQVIEQANKAAELHVKEAQILAESLINEARQRARNVIEEAEENAGLVLSEAYTEVKNAFKEYSTIEDQTEYFLQSLQSLAKETLDRVERYRGKSKKNELEKILNGVKNISVNRISHDDDFIKVELPKIQMPELPKPQKSTETHQTISESEANTRIESDLKDDHASEQEVTFTNDKNQHQNEKTEFHSQENIQEKEINKQEEEDQHKGKQGSFFDSI
jgi:cell division initiation protein